MQRRHGLDRPRRRLLWPFGLVIGGAAALVVAAGLHEPLELPLRDALLRLASTRVPASVAVVAIDEASLAHFGPWPWDRDLLARLVRAVAASGARALAVDLLLVEPRPGDAQLASALASLPAVQAVALGPRTWLLPAPPLRDAAGLAHATFEPDRDGVVRRLTATKQAAGVSYPALSLAVALLADAQRSIPVGTVLRPDFRLAWHALPVISARNVLAGSGSEQLANRIVFVGVTALGLGDRAHTPTAPGGTPLPGVVIQGGIAECLVHRDTLSPASPLLAGLIAGAFGAAALLLAARHNARQRVWATLSLLLAPLTVGALALLVGRWELPILLPTGLTALALLAGELRAGGRTRQALAHLAAALGTPSPAPHGRVANGLDDVEELAQQIAARRAAEKEARRVMAHELRTPLTSVHGLTQLLADYELTAEERRRVARLAAGEAARLRAMIEGLLNLERLSLRDFDAVAGPVDLGALVAERLALRPGGGEHAITVDAEPNLVVKGDADLLRGVIDNLVGNAITYAPPGTPIHVRVEAAHGQALLAVVDHGPGVPEAERSRIFARFVRGVASANTQGLGLGLAVVGEAVAWHRGTVDVEETPGGGATFVVRLPLLTRKEG